MAEKLISSNKIYVEKSQKSFSLLGYSFMTIITLVCLLPFWLMVSGSFSTEQSVIRNGFSIWPNPISLDAYRAIFHGWEKIARSYGVTIMVTLIGTVSALLITSMAGYVLQRQDFKYRNKISFFIYFTTLFSGGLIPWYILIVKYLNMKDTFLALILPYMLTPWFILLMRNFIKSIPFSIIEAAKIDGMDDFRIFTSIILPLSKAGLATIGLFIALNYWNDWYLSSLFIKDETKYPLQFLLYRMLSSAEFLKTAAASKLNPGSIQVPAETLKMATSVVVIGPIILLYPFLQKYFIKGVMIGSVKG